MDRIVRWAVLCALSCSWLGCTGADGTGGGVMVGAQRQQLDRADHPAPGLEPALRGWSQSRGPSAALDLARAYFPETAGPGAAEAPMRPDRALHATLPASAGGEMELATGGFVFRVREIGAGPEAASASGDGATFYGPSHFWIASGTRRIEEYAVMEDGAAAYRAEYEVRLPEGITALRDAGDLVELLDAGGTPVLRLHHAVARDRDGRSRQEPVRLSGVAPDGDDEGLPRLALLGRTLRIEMEIPLDGLAAPVVVDPGWSTTGSMAVAREGYSATLLTTGKVLVAGGSTTSWSSTIHVASAELYDPATGTWQATGSMAIPRSVHTATVLASGKVMVTGGNFSSYSPPGAGAELYDPNAGTWSGTGSMLTPRAEHSATLLLSGKVLVSGGGLTATELYDPVSQSWSAAGATSIKRTKATATVLRSGKVLVAGGYLDSSSNGWVPQATAELFDPATNVWSSTGSMAAGRYLHVAMLLPSGKVLVAGGGPSYSGVASAELYDPAAGTWSATGSLPAGRSSAAGALLPSGKVLVASAPSTVVSPGYVYDPPTGTWSTTEPMGIGTSSQPSRTPATLLPSGRVMVRSQVYSPETPGWSVTGSISSARNEHTATLLPSGKVLVAGGYLSAFSAVGGAELYDPATGTSLDTGSLTRARYGHSATLLPTGKVLVVGGRSGSAALSSAELYDPSTGEWSATGSLLTVRAHHTATLLPSGKVLVAGGSGTGVWSSAELYDPVSGTWTATGSMATARYDHTATVLPSGKVLVAAGASISGTLNSSELYDPAAGAWSAAGTLNTPRSGHTATLIDLGKVLVTAGVGGAGALVSAELYDPVTGTWSATGSLTDSRSSHTATLLRSGQVLVVGTPGTGGELYDPATGTWSAGPQMAEARRLHTATLLPSGKLLVIGGSALSGSVASAELYDGTSTQEAWRPALGPVSHLESGATVTLTGTGLTGVADGSDGTSVSSPSNFPILSLRRLDGEPFAALRATNFSSTQVTTTLPSSANGYYLLTVVAGGIPGGRLVLVSDTTPPPAPVLLSPTNGAVVSISMPALVGWSEPRSMVSLSFDGTAAGSAVADGAGNWTFTPATPLSGGLHTVLVQAVDTAGNTGPSSDSTFTVIDTTPPSLPVVISPINGARVRAAVVTGIAELGCTVTVSFDGVVAGSAAVDGTGAWAFTPAVALTQGSHSLSAKSTDGSGNVGPSSASVTFTVDSVAPAAPLVQTPVSTTSLATATPRIAGTAEPGSTATVTIDGSVAGTSNVNGSGAWSFTPSSALGEGPHTLTATATDLAGNVSATSAAVSFTVDTVAPTAPAVLSPAAGALLGSRFPAFSGTAEAGVGVSISVDGVTLAIVTADGGGAWSFTPATALAEGMRSVKVEARDLAGNLGPSSPATSFTIDSLAPGAPAVVSPANLSAVAALTPRISGTAEAGSAVSVSIDGAVVATVTASTAGGWSYTPPVALTEGPHTVAAQTADAAGNVSLRSPLISFTVDVTAPSAPVVQAPAGRAILATRYPTISGLSEAGSTVTVSIDGAVAGTAVASGAGSWSFTPATPLADGGHAVGAQARDRAGNASLQSDDNTFTVQLPNLTAPVITSPTGGAKVRGPSIAISGTAQASLSVVVILDAQAVGSTPVDAAGHWTFTPPNAVAEGVHQVAAQTTDGIRISALSAGVAFTVENLVLGAPEILAPEANATVRTATPVIQGTSIAGALVTIRIDGGVSGTTVTDGAGAWSYQPALPLGLGTHQVTATAQDASGTVSPQSAPRVFTVGSGPPQAPVITSPEAGGTVNETDLVFAGTAEPGTTVTVLLDGAIIGASTTTAAGEWSLAPATLPTRGPHDVTAQAADASGSRGPSSEVVHFTVTGQSHYGCSALPSGNLAPWSLLLLGFLRRRRRGGR